jgi:hypothetical protein
MTSNYEELLGCLRVHYFYKLSTRPSQEKILETSISILNSLKGKRKKLEIFQVHEKCSTSFS